MKYLIQNKVEKTWNDKKFVEATLLDSAEVEYKVSAWAGEFDNKDEWEGELVKNEKGYWKLVSPKAQAGANFKTAQTEKLMARKEESIGQFQKTKEWGIMEASTLRMAVDLAIAELKDPTVLDSLEEGISKWREYLVKSWDLDEKAKPPFRG